MSGVCKKGWRGWKRACLIWTVICLSGSLGGASAVHAVGARGIETASAAMSQSDSGVSDGIVVWLNAAADGEQQIYARYESTGETKALTSRKTRKDVPYIKGTTVVWADKGEQDASSTNWDIYSYDLSTGTERKLNSKAGQYANPSVDESGVVWADQQKYGRIIHYDPVSGAESSLGEGQYPILSQGRVIFKNARDGGLSMIELSSGVHRPLVSLGATNYVDWFVTNGEYVLYKQKNSNLESKYAIISLLDHSLETRDLTPMSAKVEEYAFMSIGNSQAAYLVNEGGQAVLKGVDLATAKVYSVREAEAGVQYIGFNGDRLLYAQSDGSLGSLEMSKYNTNPDLGGGEVPSPTGPNKPTEPNPTTNPVKNDGGSTLPGTSATFVVGSQGGAFSILDGQVQFMIAADAFSRDTEIKVSEMAANHYLLKDEKGRSLEAAGKVWDIQSAGEFGKAQLSLSYSNEPYWTEHREKLGIYQYQAALGCWSYVGGVTDNSKNGPSIQTTIDSPGTYAVLLRNIHFSDVDSAHWAAKEVEVLAARGIVDGTGADLFAPKSILTREQFSKMLAGTLGLEPVSPAESSFGDVPSSKWSYSWVEAAAAAGIVEGDHGLFKPEDALTREQMMAMLVRAVKDRLENNQTQGAELNRFKDQEMISEWALPFVRQAVALKLVEGNGELIQTRATTTRAEAAVVLYRLLEQLNEL